jgi:hypothetical protein
MHRLVVWLALLLAFVTVGCTRDGNREQESAGATSRRQPATTLVPAVSRMATAPQACTAQGTTALVKGFFGALSSGRVLALNEFFAPVPRFRWYSVSAPPGVRLNRSAMDRGTLLGYLARRQGSHERIDVEQVTFNGYRATDHTGHFAMELRRRADDVSGGWQRLSGKGAVDCGSGKLMVVSIGTAH